MNLYRKDELISLMKQLDFKVTHLEEHYDYALEPTLDLWYNNISKLEREEKTKMTKTRTKKTEERTVKGKERREKHIH